MELKKKVDSVFWPYVTKPGRYFGNEYNAVIKQPAEAELRIALCFSDLYESGIGNINFEALYHFLNAERQIWAERCYAPGTDAEALMKQHEIALFVLESKTALSDFDILGFYFQERLAYSNLLPMMNLGNITFRSENRSEKEPLVIGCGPAFSNPEPVADFFDVCIIGDASEAWLEIAKVYLDHPGSAKSVLLQKMSEIPGVYIPSYYESRYNSFLEFQSIHKTADFAPERVYRRTAGKNSISSKYFDPLVPIGVHHRLSNLDLQWQSYAGKKENLLNVPARFSETTASQIEGDAFYEIQKNLRKAGMSRIEKLMAYNRSHLENGWIYTKAMAVLYGQKIALSHSSARFTIPSEMAKDFFNAVKEAEFVLYPISGSRRLRQVSNVLFKEQAFLDALYGVLESGWVKVRLHFLIGLPTEKDNDVQETISFIRKCASLLKKFSEATITIVLQVFTPAPGTVFQWEKQEGKSRVQEKFSQIREACSETGLNFYCQNADMAALQTAFARGGRSLSAVLEKAWEKGGRFANVSDHFRLDPWQKSFEETEDRLHRYLMPISVTVALPWEHIDGGIPKSRLKEDKLKAYQAQKDAGNKDVVMLGYGGVSETELARILQTVSREMAIFQAANTSKSVVEVTPQNTQMQYGRKGRKRQSPTAIIKRKVRIRYAKAGMARFLSSIDIVQVLGRSAKLAKIPLVYSQGLRRNPKISYGPPLPGGIASTAEYMDIEVEMGRETDIQNRYNEFLPEGIKILQYQGILNKIPALASAINRSTYEALLPDSENLEVAISQWLAQEDITVKRPGKEGNKTFNIRPYVETLNIKDGKLFITIDTVEGKTARVTEVLTSLLTPEGLDYRQFPVQRTGQYIKKENLILTPFDVIQ